MLIRREYNKRKDRVTSSINPLFFIVAAIILALVIYSFSVTSGKHTTVDGTDKYGRAVRD